MQNAVLEWDVSRLKEEFEELKQRVEALEKDESRFVSSNASKLKEVLQEMKEHRERLTEYNTSLLDLNNEFSLFKAWKESTEKFFETIRKLLHIK